MNPARSTRLHWITGRGAVVVMQEMERREAEKRRRRVFGYGKYLRALLPVRTIRSAGASGG
jgi:hypothetical protein